MSNQILIRTSDNLTHGPFDLSPDGEIDLSGIDSPNTRAALLDGQRQPYTPPEAIALPPEPNPAAFRAALASSVSWNEWAETISPVRYTNLATAAAQGNWPEAQAIYNAIKASTPPEFAAVAAWQALADTHAIPIAF